MCEAEEKKCADCGNPFVGLPEDKYCPNCTVLRRRAARPRSPLADDSEWAKLMLAK